MLVMQKSTIPSWVMKGPIERVSNRASGRSNNSCLGHLVRPDISGSFPPSDSIDY